MIDQPEPPRPFAGEYSYCSAAFYKIRFSVTYYDDPDDPESRAVGKETFYVIGEIGCEQAIEHARHHLWEVLDGNGFMDPEGNDCNVERFELSSATRVRKIPQLKHARYTLLIVRDELPEE